MIQIDIRNATLKDASALARLSTQLGYSTSLVESKDRLSGILGSDEHAVIVACLGDGTVVGWVHAYLALSVESNPFVEIGGFVPSS